MTDQTLIERLEAYHKAIQCDALANVVHPNLSRVAQGQKLGEFAACLKEAIDALSPVLPDDVSELTRKIKGCPIIKSEKQGGKWVRYRMIYDSDLQAAIDLIERLARDNMLREDEILHRENIAKEQEQYIKKLEDATKIQASHITDLEDQINERT